MLVRDLRADAGSARARIVEVEAYIGESDLASHARFGRTNRNAVMYGPPGIAYVYLVYGMYDCLNVVTEPEGRPAAVLIRAVEAADDASAAAMRAARHERWLARQRSPDGIAIAREEARLGATPTSRIASGPGLVAASFGLTRADTGSDLLDPRSSIRLEPGRQPGRVDATPRIGIDYAPEPWLSQPWRFLDPDSPAVSGSRPRGRAS